MWKIRKKIMSKKKVRITNELIKKAELVFNDGKGTLTRSELRALFRKGYLERELKTAADGSKRYGYRLAPII